MIRKTTLTLSAAALAVAMAVPSAWAESNGSDDNGNWRLGRIEPAVAERIKSQLEGEGYTVRRIKRDDGLIEVYAMKDGQRFELYLDENLQITNRKTDD